MRVIALSLLALTLSCGQQPTTIGAKNFTESGILAEIARQLLVADGSPAIVRELGGSQIAWTALISGEIDLYPEYSGTLRHEILADLDLTENGALQRALDQRGIRVGPVLGFENTYALGMRREQAASLGITRVSDLRNHPELAFGFSSEFMDRSDGWPGLQRRYRLPQENVRGLNHDLAYQGLREGAIDLVDLYTTDAEIRRYDLLPLVDDLGYFPEYQAMLLYRKDLPARITDQLDRLDGRISQERMVALNAEAKIESASDRAVAAAFLHDEFTIDSQEQDQSLIGAILSHSAAHLLLVGISLFAAILIGIPLGLAAAYRPGFGRIALAILGIIQTMPSIALLVFMIPLLGIGSDAAILALFLYSLLPIVRNTCTGIEMIPHSLRDAATAIGLPPAARLLRVELPLAAPAIFSGIKTSAVINVGTATLGAWIGAGGLGQPIFTGLSRYDIPMILSGAIPAACLAVLVSGFFDLLARWAISPGLMKS